MENHNYNEIIGNSQRLTSTYLAAQGALMTNSFAMSIPASTIT